MSEQAVEQHGRQVELEYDLRVEDLADAVRVLIRKRGGLYGLFLHPVLHVCVGLVGAALVALGLRGDHGGFFAFGIGLVAWAVLMYRSPRISARNLLKANQHHGTMRVSVGEDGVRTASTHMDARMAWTNYGSYAEGEHCFVLRSPDRRGNCAAVLVKRGARSPEDLDRLRALLDTRLPRVR
ncbi:hypothetical protein AB0C59_08050 [Streptomyces sp. NPDC048664]|uniref:YcxB family protein n=1 Tax=Streptomyces sp. NPDC048664 TaxID=3154505 RepID=UPI003422C9FB